MNTDALKTHVTNIRAAVNSGTFDKAAVNAACDAIEKDHLSEPVPTTRADAEQVGKPFQPGGTVEPAHPAKAPTAAEQRKLDADNKHK